ncbi:unnamed protein product [Polarella glacialis]|uniref:S1 motif domain-containing protein n=1 Tax=Polarella glacialis TaxID=89957 RepID=A0A813M1Z3_POLGL|nr:unnamed protein product [Polarella glacialis]
MGDLAERALNLRGERRQAEAWSEPKGFRNIRAGGPPQAEGLEAGTKARRGGRGSGALSAHRAPKEALSALEQEQHVSSTGRHAAARQHRIRTTQPHQQQQDLPSPVVPTGSNPQQAQQPQQLNRELQPRREQPGRQQQEEDVPRDPVFPPSDRGCPPPAQRPARRLLGLAKVSAAARSVGLAGDAARPSDVGVRSSNGVGRPHASHVLEGRQDDTVANNCLEDETDEELVKWLESRRLNKDRPDSHSADVDRKDEDDELPGEDQEDLWEQEEGNKPTDADQERYSEATKMCKEEKEAQPDSSMDEDEEELIPPDADEEHDEEDIPELEALEAATGRAVPDNVDYASDVEDDEGLEEQEEDGEWEDEDEKKDSHDKEEEYDKEDAAEGEYNEDEELIELDSDVNEDCDELQGLDACLDTKVRFDNRVKLNEGDGEVTKRIPVVPSLNAVTDADRRRIQQAEAMHDGLHSSGANLPQQAVGLKLRQSQLSQQPEGDSWPKRILKAVERKIPEVRPQDEWSAARVMVVRGALGAVVTLASGCGKAWLPQDKIRPPVRKSEAEICEALGKTIRVRISGHSKQANLPLVTMWSAAQEANWNESYNRELQRAMGERERKREQDRLFLRQSLDPSEWVDGIVQGVKSYGIFVQIYSALTNVLVPVGDIPEDLTTIGTRGEEEGPRIPDLRVHDKVQIRITSYEGQDAKGRDKYRCTMLPMTDVSVYSGDAAAGGFKRGSKSSNAHGKAKGDGKGDGRSKVRATESCSVWFEGRALEDESTLAHEEAFEVNMLHAEELEQQFGHTDRRAFLARRGFTVVDYATSMQLSEACKAKAATKPDDQKAQTVMLKPLQVWVNFLQNSRMIGKINVSGSMSDYEKERLAVDLALQEANEAVQDGANIARVDITERGVLIRVKTDGGVSKIELLYTASFPHARCSVVDD